MLRIIIPENEYFNNTTQEFINIKETELSLEHSLVSISKWESKWHKPFLSKEEKTNEEMIDYIRCMTITQNVNPMVYSFLSNDNIKSINEYINNPMTATTFSENKKGTNREIITSEIIYYWMVSYQIPFECQRWHINRLLTLIRVCSIKNQPSKKMPMNEIMRSNKNLNQIRKSKLNTRG